MVVWFTGLSGAGKSTLASKVFAVLKEQGYQVEHLDGDLIRSVFPETLFTRSERDRHVKWAGFLASMLEKHGVIVIASFIAPYEEARQFVRRICRDFVEVYVSTPLEECERRDVKGLYRRAREGEIKGFTGLDDPYETPQHPELILDTTKMAADHAVQIVLDCMRTRLRK